MINAADRKEEYLRDAFNLLQTHMIFLSKAKENKQADSQASTASNILPREIMNLIGLQMSALEALEQLSALVSLMQTPGFNFDTDALIIINNALASAISMSCYALNSIQHIYNTNFARVTELIGNRKEELLRKAADTGNALAVAQLLKINGIDVNAEDNCGWTALIFASSHGHKTIVTDLLKADGILVNAQNHDGFTALMRASWSGHTSIVTELLNKDGILINVINKESCTALMIASWNGHTSVVTELLKKDGILVNAQDKDGYTALMKASSKGHASVVTELLKKDGILANAQDEGGWSALMFAATVGNESIVHQLCIKQLFDASFDQGNALFQQLTNEMKSANNSTTISPASLCANLLISVEALPTSDEKIALLEKALSGSNAFSALMQKGQRIKIQEALSELKSSQKAQSSNYTQPVLFSEAAGAPSSSSNPTANTSSKLIRSECCNQ